MIASSGVQSCTPSDGPICIATECEINIRISVMQVTAERRGEFTRRPPAERLRLRRRVPSRAYEQQRAHLLRVARELLVTQGAGAVTLERIGALAGLPAPPVQAIFVTREECLAALHDTASSELARAMQRAYTREQRWQEGVRAALHELLTMMEAEPNIGRFLVVDALRGGPELFAQRSRRISELAAAFDEHRPCPSPELLPAPFGAEAVIGTVVAVLHGRLLEEQRPPLVEHLGPLMGMLIAPYLGVMAACEELVR